VQVNMFDAKSQLSQLVKAALAGEEVIIASHGKPQVKLVPCRSSPGLRGAGSLSAVRPDLGIAQLDAAFTPAVDREVEHLLSTAL
jgi:prevent-host-death family protein